MSDADTCTRRRSVRPDSGVWTNDWKPDGEVVQHSILRQQRGTYIQQFIEDLDVGNPRMLGRQKYKLDRPFTQALAELPDE